MNTSQQASGGRISAPVNDGYPFRCIVWECRWGEWRVAEIFEWSTFAGADLAGLETCAEPYPDGVTAMHYYVGEVA